MRKVTYSLGVSLDGYMKGPDGSFTWGAHDEEIFRFAMEQIQRVDVHLMGRRLYETMLFWETTEGLDALGREWAALWNPLPKVVFSSTLTEVQGNARLAKGGLAEEIAALREGSGEIAIGGAELAMGAAALDLIDEYLPKVTPVILGGGTPFSPPHPVNLQWVESRSFDSRMVYSRYRVLR